MNDARQTCLLVLGMHRSGTSAITRLLSLAGAKLPLRMLGAGAGNETGHWEPKALVAYHDRLLADIGSSWHDWHGPDFSRLPPRRRENLKREIADIIAADFRGADLFVVKDPRICRFAPLVIEALHDAGIRVVPILIFRNPLDVTRSLEKRKEAWPAGCSQVDAALLWLRHVLDADGATRDLPRSIVSYDGLFSDWRRVLSDIAGQTSIDFGCATDEISPMVEEFLSPGLRHHRHSMEDVLLNPALCGWGGEAYSALRILEESPGSKEALSELDRISDSLNRALPVLIALTDAKKTARRAAENTKQVKHTQLPQAQIERCKELESANTAPSAQVTEPSTSPHSGTERLGKEATQVEAQVSAQVAIKEREINNLSQNLADARQEELRLRLVIDQIHRSTSWQITKPLRGIKQFLIRRKNPIRAQRDR